jgi:hypothetical protein
MNLLRVLLLAALVITLGSCGGPAATTTKTANASTGYEWRRLCSTLGAPGGEITRAQFLAAANDKEAAAQVFDACDVDRTGVLTEKEATQNPTYFENLKSQVILFHTPRE